MSIFIVSTDNIFSEKNEDKSQSLLVDDETIAIAYDDIFYWWYSQYVRDNPHNTLKDYRYHIQARVREARDQNLLYIAILLDIIMLPGAHSFWRGY